MSLFAQVQPNLVCLKRNSKAKGKQANGKKVKGGNNFPQYYIICIYLIAYNRYLKINMIFSGYKKIFQDRNKNGRLNETGL